MVGGIMVGGIDWERIASGMSDAVMEGIERENAEYRALYPEWGDAIAALVHERKVIEEREKEIADLKGRVKRLKRALKAALK